jgi:hypothetical protein
MRIFWGRDEFYDAGLLWYMPRVYRIDEKSFCLSYSDAGSDSFIISRDTRAVTLRPTAHFVENTQQLLSNPASTHRYTVADSDDKFKENLIRMKLDPLLVNLVLLIFQIFYVIHLFACFWHYMAINIRNENAENGYDLSSSAYKTNWVDQFNYGSQSNLSRYVASMYWTTATMLTIGYGDIHATNNGERIFSIATMLTGGKT